MLCCLTSRPFPPGTVVIILCYVCYYLINKTRNKITAKQSRVRRKQLIGDTEKENEKLKKENAILKKISL